MLEGKTQLLIHGVPLQPPDVRCPLQAVAEYGEKWSKVAQHVPSRTDVQCRERFKNVLDPKLTSEPWTAGENRHMSPAGNGMLVAPCRTLQCGDGLYACHGTYSSCDLHIRPTFSAAFDRGGQAVAGSSGAMSGRQRPHTVGEGGSPAARPHRQRLQAETSAACQGSSGRHCTVRHLSQACCSSHIQ